MIGRIRTWPKRMCLAWHNFWMRETYPHIISIVRIVMGGWLLFYWAIRLPNVDMLYTTDGIVFPTYPSYLPEWLQWIWEVPDPSVALWIYGIHLLALLFLTLGFHTRTSALMACTTSWYYYYLSHHHFHTSYDRLYMMSLLFLALSSAGETYSMQAWEKYGSPLKWKNMVSIFPQRMFAFQLTMTYAGVGLQKLWLPGWQGGQMLWFSMIGVWGTPLAFKITSLGWSPIYHFMVNIVKILEVFLPFSFWIKKHHIRWVGFISGFLFHLFVDLLLYIWWFAVLIPAYIVFFEPEEIYSWLQKIGKGKLTQEA